MMKKSLWGLSSLIALAVAPAIAAADEPVDGEGTGDDAGDAGALPEDGAPPADETSPDAAATEDAAPAPAPAAAAKPGLTLPAGKINIAVNVEMNVGADAVAKPVSIAPDVSYGVNDDLTVSLVHSRFAASGFRGAAGGGLCLTGTENGCAKVYDNVGLEALYSVARGPLTVAANGGVHALSLDAGSYSLKLGAKIRYTAGKVNVLTSPSVFVAATNRKDDDATTVDNLDRIWVPVAVGYAVSPKVWVAGSTGLKTPLSGAGDAWQLAIGALATYKVDAKLTVGCSLIFGQIAGGEPDPAPEPSIVGPDYRWVQGWVSYTL